MMKLISINILVLVILVAGLELSGGLLLKKGEKGTPIVEYKSVEYIQEDLVLGFKPIAGVTAQSTKRKGSEIIYDVSYSFDQFGRRIIPQDESIKKESHIVILGDSNVFGEGLNVNQTLPFFLSKRFTSSHLYNYAFRGYGAGNSLALTESNRLSREVLEKKGLVLFFFKTTHAVRLVGSLPLFRWSDGWHPFYKLNGDGELVRDGTFITAQPLLTYLKKKFARSNLNKYFKINYPDPYSPKPFEKLCQAFYQMKNNVKKQFSESQLVVVLWGSSRNLSAVKGCLEDRKVDFVDLVEGKKRAPVNSAIHPLDHHFNESTHQFYSNELSLKLLEQGLISL